MVLEFVIFGGRHEEKAVRELREIVAGRHPKSASGSHGKRAEGHNRAPQTGPNSFGKKGT
jgi:hypothetical protein